MPSVQSENEKSLRTFLQNLATQDWVQRSERRWWPNFVFHYTDIRNAVNILTEQTIYSRLKAEQLGKLVISSGSPEILAGTSLDIRNCVRFYLRPQTPTQYHAEGVHSALTLGGSPFPNAHCPVPVFFLFDAAAILARPDVRFSDRGLGGSGYKLGHTLEDLESMPWKRIYHNSWVDRNDPRNARDIIACRNAEVVVPEKIDLKALRFIYCRSDAEKDTLLHSLSPDLRRHYQSKIFASNRIQLFFRHHTFIESAALSAEGIHLRFSPDTKSPGPFRFCMQIALPKTVSHEIENFILGPSFEYTIPFQRPLSEYSIQVTLDGYLVYAGKFEDINIPF